MWTGAENSPTTRGSGAWGGNSEVFFKPSRFLVFLDLFPRPSCCVRDLPRSTWEKRRNDGLGLGLGLGLLGFAVVIG